MARETRHFHAHLILIITVHLGILFHLGRKMRTMAMSLGPASTVLDLLVGRLRFRLRGPMPHSGLPLPARGADRRQRYGLDFSGLHLGLIERGSS